VVFELEEGPRYQLAYGGRWESGRGIGVVVDAADRNSLGRGHTSGGRVVYGADTKSLRLYHMIPRVVGERSTLELFVEGGEETRTGVKTEGVQSWIQLTFPLTERVLNRVYTVFDHRDVTVEVPDPNEPIDDRVTSPRLGWQVAFDTRARTLGLQRRDGLFVGFDFSGSHQAVGSDLTVMALFGQLKLFLPLDHQEKGRLTWAQSFRAGLTDARDDEVPFIDRLRAGGEFSVRGYPTDSLGPRDQNGVPLGGEVMFVVNQEVHSRIWGSISGLVFFDAGNVWESKGTLEAELFKSVGAGLRYVSPVGPLRLDYAYPLDRRPGDPEYKVYFGFGNVF
jgi:outer membrane protein assembly factor BamA